MKRLEHCRITVTGGAGFIGSNLVEKLLAQDNEVVVLDNFSTGKHENIEPFLSDRRFTLIEGDIRNMADCRRAVDGADYVLHEAARGSVQRSIEDPMTTTEVNIGGFVNMLFAAAQAKVKRFVYASSSSVYGDNPALPKVEENIGRALSPYALTKHANELYACNFHDLYGIETIGLRYFNVFGKRQDPQGAYAAVIPKFVQSLLNHTSPVINGDGSYSRDFTYVDNVVHANELALLCEEKSSLNEIYNVSLGGRITLRELFESLRSALAEYDPAIKVIPAVYGPERVGDIPHSQACIEKIVKNLNYTPQVSVEEGIKKAVKWYYEKFQQK